MSTFLADLRRQRRDRKLKRQQENQEPVDEAPDIDDAVIVPAKGFLVGGVRLPTYEPKSELDVMHSSSHVFLSISDVLKTISRDVHIARCVLFETARLQRPLLSVGPLKLFDNARVVDMELIKLDKVLDQGYELIDAELRDEEQGKQSLILEGDLFQKALRMYFISFCFVIPMCSIWSEELWC